ncbi:MAG: TRAP transporter substrate-binding protein [Alphaproteobacteria bacterium]
MYSVSSLIARLGRVAALGVLVAGTAASAQEVKLALDSRPDKATSGSYVFADALVEALKASGWQIKVLPVNSIGGEAERLDQTSQGLLEINQADFGRAGQINKLAFGFGLPYVFETIEHLDKAEAQGKLLEKINAGMTPKGVRLVALMAVGGSVGIFNTKREITKPEDLKGLRLRALDQNQLKLFEAWGANGVVIAMPEVATALQTGTADGYLNPPFVPFIFGHQTILKYYTSAKVLQPLRSVLVSEDWYKKLAADKKKQFDAAVVKATAANRAWVANSDKAAYVQLEKAGIKITELSPAARQKFQDLSKPAYTAILSEAEAKLFLDAAAKAK